jgi:hypothetical protein
VLYSICVIKNSVLVAEVGLTESLCLLINLAYVCGLDRLGEANFATHDLIPSIVLRGACTAWGRVSLAITQISVQQ